MARRQIEVKPGRFVTVNFEDPFPLGMRLWVIIQGRLVDNSDGEPVRTAVTIVLDPPNRQLQTVIAADGWMLLAGRPQRLFPNLALQPYTVGFTIYAARYLPLVQAPLLPATAGFPNLFQPLSLGDILLQPV